MNLTDATYYSLEADREYMSNSQLKNWMKCAAAEKARQSGEYIEPEATHFIGGRFAHLLALEPEKRESFIAENPGRFTLKGTVRAEFSWIEPAIEAMNRQPVFAGMLANGTHEVTIEFTLGGIMWKCRIDNLRADDDQFDDLKFMRDFADSWSKTERAYVPWWQSYDYRQQMAIYREAIRQEYGKTCTPNLIGVTKQDPPDFDWIQFRDADALAASLANVEAVLPMVVAWKSGDETAPRCESCRYCRATKQIKKPKVA